MQIALHVQFADFHSILINHHTMHIMYPQQSIKMKEYESKNKNKNKNNRTRTKREERRKGAADSDQRQRPAGRVCIKTKNSGTYMSCKLN